MYIYEKLLYFKIEDKYMHPELFEISQIFKKDKFLII